MEEEEASPDSRHHTGSPPGAWSGAPPLRREIYELLRNNPPHKALAIAKALGRKTTRDVNPELYSMKDLKLLDCTEDKLWTLRSPTCAAECRTNMKPSVRTESGTASNVTEQQKKILDLLHTNKPMRGLDIARGMGKTTAKDVNPDLYRMETMGLLSRRDNLWTVRSQRSTGSKEETAECGTLRGDAIQSGGRNGTQDAYTADNIGTNQELVPKTSATTIINNYYIRDSQNIQIGHENVLISVTELNCESHKLQTASQQCDSGIGEFSTQQNSCTNQMEDQSLPETDLSNAEESQRPSLPTSSPSSTHHRTRDCLLEITDGLKLVTLDDGDCHGASGYIVSTHDANTDNVNNHDANSHSASSQDVSTHDASTHIVSTHNVSYHDVNNHSARSHDVSTHDVSTHDASTHNVSSHDASTHGASGEDDADARSGV